MASSIPTRRATRLTRTTIQKANENENARPSRLTTRAKPPSGSSTGTVGMSRVTAATAASRAKTTTTLGDGKVDPAATKRKREALGEVTTNNRSRASKDLGKGKEIEKPESSILASKTTTTTSMTIRQPLRSVGSSAQSTRRMITKTVTSVATGKAALKQVKEEGETRDDHAMAIDEKPAPARRISTRRSIVSALHDTIPAQPTREQSAEDDQEDEPAHKKRRTSSDAPEQDEDLIAPHVVDTPETVTHELAEGEADPSGEGWQDLDAEDADDPLMVSEYVAEIFDYLRQVEQTTMPNPNYMENQRELAWKMRGILTDWLISVHIRFRLLPETLFLAVNIIDRFLSARVVSLAKLQLVGITCMFIAAKTEEIVSPGVANFLYVADSSYTENEILQAERYVLKTLEWNLSYPNAIHFLRRISKADEYDMQVRTIAKYLLEIGIVEWRLLAAPPSLMAAAAIWLGRLILDRDVWTPNLAHYSGYAESSLVPTANFMLNYILKPVKHEAFYKKYAGKRYMKSSVWCREWALQRWPEGAQIDLRAVLPALRADIAQVRIEQQQRKQAARH